MRMGSTTIKEALSEPAKLSQVQQELSLPETSSRTALAKLLCIRFGFRNARGSPQVYSCLKALRELESEGHFRLPPRRLNIVAYWRPRRLSEPVPEAQDVPSVLGDIRGLHLLQVNPSDETAMRIWNELIAREHPQGERRLVGRQLKYLVASKHGWLGAVGFSASALRLEARDQWIGWTGDERRRHQDRVVNLSRFLIRSCVHCPNLA